MATVPNLNVDMPPRPQSKLSLARGAIFALVVVLCGLIIRNATLESTDIDPAKAQANLKFQDRASDVSADERSAASTAAPAPVPSSVGQAEIVKVFKVSSSSADSPQIERRYTGIVTPAKSSELGFKTTGRLEKLLVDQGDPVRQGDLLAVLDTKTLAADKKVLEADLLAARALLAELEAGPRRETILAAEAKLKEYRSRLELAEITSSRRKQLFEADAGSRQAMDDARLQAEAAQSQVENQLKVVEELKAGTRKEKIAAQKAAVAKLLASIQRLEVELEESKLFAPYDAIVSQRMVDDGMIVSPGKTLFRVVQTTEAEAWIGLPIEVVNQLQVGGQYEVEINEESHAVVLQTILPELDRTTRTQTGIFSLPDSVARFGQVVRLVHSVEQTQAEGFWLPTSALTYGVRGLWAVYVAIPREDSKANSADSNYVLERRSVEILQTGDERVLVRGTISEGDQVVAAGAQKLVAGQVVSLSQDSAE